MTRLCFTFLALSIATCLFAQQNIKISVNNSEPRVGQEFILTVESEFLDSYLKQVLPTELTISTGPFSTSDTYRKLMATKEGQMTIGPLEFTFNGVKYKSNSITINVIPMLGDSEGLWVRKIRLDEDDYIVIEQILIAKKITTYDKSTTTDTWESRSDEFARLIVDTDFEGIKFKDSRSGIGGHPDILNSHPSEISYSYKYYKIIKSPDFDGKVKLTKKHFVNLPDDVELKTIVIK